MQNWFEKSNEEILSYIKKEYGTIDLIFIGQYYPHQGTVRFINVKTTDYFSLNFLGNEELNTLLKGKKLWIHISKEIPKLKVDLFYQFKAKLRSIQIRKTYQNPFALEFDETYTPNLDEPEPKRKKSVIFHQI